MLGNHSIFPALLFYFGDHSIAQSGPELVIILLPHSLKCFFFLISFLETKSGSEAQASLELTIPPPLPQSVEMTVLCQYTCSSKAFPKVNLFYCMLTLPSPPSSVSVSIHRGSWAPGRTDLCGFNNQARDIGRPCRHKGTLAVFTLLFCRRASPLQAFARRKSPLRIAILFPNFMSFSGPSEDCNSLKFTIPRCTRRAVCISSVISAKLLWLKHKEKVCINVKTVLVYDQCQDSVLKNKTMHTFWFWGSKEGCVLF